jgi:DNA-directed RNA polymerase beta' subunit
MIDKNAPSGITYYSKIADLAFYVLSGDEILQESHVNITNKEIMKGDRPAVEGLYDAHMGTTDFGWNCHTCGNRKTICPGHFGSIDLRYPVKSPMFRDELLKWLKVICYNCGELIVEKKTKVPPNKRLSELVKNVKGVKKCPHCQIPHMQVVKDKKRPFIFYRQQEEAKKILDRKEFYNHHIKTVLERIRDDTVIRLGKPLRSHPRNFIMTTIPAPPNTIRPDLKKIGGTRSSNSDITSLMKTIVEINEALPETIPEDSQITQTLEAAYSNLDMAYYTMVKGGSSGDIKMVTNTNKPPVAIAEHIPRKVGRIRKNLMGKRVEYMIRSVITGDSRLRVNEVGVPMIHARDLEIPEVVTARNKNRLMTYFLNKTNHYPGCKHIIKKSDGNTYRIDLIDQNYVLQEGDIIMRDMITGDHLCFNRQPSLLFSNIAGMRVIVMETGETLRINPSVCSYFNADFDGDQINLV